MTDIFSLNQRSNKPTRKSRIQSAKKLGIDIKKPFEEITSPDIEEYIYNWKKQKTRTAKAENLLKMNTRLFFKWFYLSPLLAKAEREEELTEREGRELRRLKRRGEYPLVVEDLALKDTSQEKITREELWTDEEFNVALDQCRYQRDRALISLG